MVTYAIALTSLSINRMVGITSSHGNTAPLKRVLTMRLTEAPGVDIVVLVILLSCYNNSIITVRQGLLIGKDDNIVIELWVFTCTVAGYLLRQKTWGLYVPR